MSTQNRVKIDRSKFPRRNKPANSTSFSTSNDSSIGSDSGQVIKKKIKETSLNGNSYLLRFNDERINRKRKLDQKSKQLIQENNQSDSKQHVSENQLQVPEFQTQLNQFKSNLNKFKIPKKNL